ncbi:MAG: ABC transporter ATP-binding protein [Halococcoides sp.]
MAAIELTDLQKAYGSIDALDGLTLSIEDGELFGLLGPNGAGKTTTMSILTGQIRPDEGRVRVLDVDPVTEPVAVRERVGILPERSSPPSFLTPREYFQFVGTVRGISDEDIEAATDEWADRLDLSGHLDTLSTDISRGQKQKVMIVAAFLHEPSVVFIDEPLANLDPIVQETVKEFLAGYADDHTVCFSTHDVTVAAELCTRVGIVHEGQLVATVRPAETDERLIDIFVDRVGGDPA